MTTNPARGSRLEARGNCLEPSAFSLQPLASSFQLLASSCRGSHAGVTLAEILVAITISVIIFWTLGQLDVTRLLETDKVRRTATTPPEAELAMVHLSRQLQQADRVVVSSDGQATPANVCARVPINKDALDTVAGYRWAQYVHDPTAQKVLYYTFDAAGVPTLTDQFRNVSAFTLQTRSESPPPPGGEPTPADTNVLEFALTATDPHPETGATFPYRAQVTLRAGAYTDLSNSLAPPGVAEVPAACSGCNNDGTCGPGETCSSCPADCGPCTCDNDGVCEPPGETCQTCPGDCTTGCCNENGICDPGETNASCPGDCPPICNNDGVCDPGETYPDCEDCLCPPTCNNNGICEDWLCEQVGTCADCGPPPPRPLCPNGVCDPGEDCTTCPEDCGTICRGGDCGNGTCDPWEDCTTCRIDCGGASCDVCNYNGVCDPGESYPDCPDCKPCLNPPCCNNNGICDPGEDATSCPSDCNPCPTFVKLEECIDWRGVGGTGISCYEFGSLLTGGGMNPQADPSGVPTPNTWCYPTGTPVKFTAKTCLPKEVPRVYRYQFTQWRMRRDGVEIEGSWNEPNPTTIPVAGGEFTVQAHYLVDKSQCGGSLRCPGDPPTCINGRCEGGPFNGDPCRCEFDCLPFPVGAACVSNCGDGICGSGESCENCAVDCPPRTICAPETVCDPDGSNCRAVNTCFSAGTKILTPSGEVSIEQLTAGDVVLSMDPQTQALVPASVERLHQTVAEALLEVSLSDGRTVRVTPEHPFFDPTTAAYRPIREFRVGDAVLLRPGADSAPQPIQIIVIRPLPDRHVPVYNLTVSGPHQNYLAEGLLVHNKTCVVYTDE